MPTHLVVYQHDAAHVLVIREDRALDGTFVTAFGLMPDGSWRRANGHGSYPEECVLPIEPAVKIVPGEGR